MIAAKIIAIPSSLKNPADSFHKKIPINVPTRGSTVAKIAALPASRPESPNV